MPRWDEATRASHRDALQDLFGEAVSWEELDRELAACGLSLDRKGQGLVIGSETGTMKLSDLGRNVRLKGLEERFGKAFADHEAVRSSPPPPAPSAEFEQLADASATAEMSYYLYRMGLASRDEVTRNFEVRDRARDQVDQSKAMMERLSSRVTQEVPKKPEPEDEPPARDRKRGRGR
jgi:hypothetical protein